MQSLYEVEFIQSKESPGSWKRKFEPPGSESLYFIYRPKQKATALVKAVAFQAFSQVRKTS